jgi:tetratricopeptide (TPR) repeat protein
VTANVVSAIAPRLEQAEIERARRKPTESLDAYDYFLRGMAAFHKWNREANDEALAMFYKSIALDPDYAAAYAMAARCYSQRKTSGWMIDPARETAETAMLAGRAAELGREDALALSSAGTALVIVVGDFDGGGACIERAIALNSNLAWAWLSSATMNAFGGEPEIAIEHANRALRLSPHDTQIFAMHFTIALAHFVAGRHAEASSWAAMACRERPDHIPTNCMVAASGVLTGNPAAAADDLARLRQLAPGLRIANLRERLPMRRSEHFDRWADAMRKAGLPE